MQVVGYNDNRSLHTIDEFIKYYKTGNYRFANQESNKYLFPWSSGILSTILARQGKGDLAWQFIEDTRPTICSFGGMTEVMEDDQWNMQYFGTAQGAVCTAIHNLLLQFDEERIRIFPALPINWNNASFDRLLAAGCEISAQFDRSRGSVDGTIKNILDHQIVRTIMYKGRMLEIL